jgi:hypothetical protein
MADQDRNNQEIGEQRELERALSLLKPADSRIDRDCFLFLAGRASAEGIRPGSAFGRWMWPAATVLSSLAVVVLSVLLVTRTQPGGSHAESMSDNDDRIRPPAVAEERSGNSQSVVAQLSSPRTSESSEIGPEMPGRTIDSSLVPPPDEEARALATGSNYPRLRSFVLAYGIDALPEPAPIRQSASDSGIGNEPSTERELLRQSLKGRSAG